MKLFGTARLARVFLAALVSWFAVQAFGIQRVPHPLQDVMHRADDRVRAAYAVVDSVKRARGLPFAAESQVPWRALLGEDYTPITTTLGSLAAKEAATNPAWAGLMVRLLDEAGVGRGDTVGILASGSFPSLNLATMAAVQELGAESKQVASLGASSFGANSRLATWLDIRAWVLSAGVMDAGSLLVTLGAEDDVGGGMTEEGKAWLQQAQDRNGQPALMAESLESAIAARLDCLDSSTLTAVVNIGGGQAALGHCPHAANLPPGRWPASPVCRCPDRGALTRLQERGVPVINLLSIRELAIQHGLDPEPGAEYRNIGQPDMVTRADGRWVLGALAFVALSIIRLPKRRPNPIS
jgi:poly-gamma-glutamate system protein